MRTIARRRPLLARSCELLTAESAALESRLRQIHAIYLFKGRAVRLRKEPS